MTELSAAAAASSTPELRKRSTKATADKVHQTTSNKQTSAPPPKSALAQALGILTVLFQLVLVSSVLSYLITDTFVWGYKGKYLNLHTYLPKKELVLTTQELAGYDGSDPTKPIYLAVGGEVFDVSAGAPFYGKGGSYGFFSGKDASRAYATGCFQTHLTHDIRGLTAEQLEAIEGWKKFYRDHAKYFSVGKVVHDEIDPDAPMLEDCNKPVAAKP